MTSTDHPTHAAIEAVYRTESPRVLATLIRLLGDFERAEEALHDAVAVAVEQWPNAGIPANPRAWLVSTARFRAIDAMRRRSRLDASASKVAEALHPEADELDDDQLVADDQLRLIFICCHPALAQEARVALTLREVCGLTTEDIARAFLVSPSTVAQRIVRAKQKIRQAAIPYALPDHAALPARLDAVLQVIYLVFNEGYAASAGDAVVRHDLTANAIRLARHLAQLLPEAEVHGLLALMLLHDARRSTRSTPDGALVLLADQDRSRWDRAQIAEGAALVAQALRTRRFGPFTVQAAIAAVHAEAPSAAATDWHEIVGLYDVLCRLEDTPVVQLNRAVALAMRDGPAAALPIIEPLRQPGGPLAGYAYAHAAAADLHLRLGDAGPAVAAYRQALALTRQGPERRFLEERLASLLAPR